jgi:NAD-dependent dihydropyrimidine dehydrogenase PreA subunit
MKLRYLRDVVTLNLEDDLCIGCGRCLQVCPHEVFLMENGKAQIIDRDACMECGACQMNCPTAAIRVRSGVGCAHAVVKGKIKGEEVTCGCSENPSCCC